MTTTSTKSVNKKRQVSEIEQATVRFAGDSGDGMQLVGDQFTHSSVLFGNDVATLPDYPAEIRAPAGSLGGVSGFQINFAGKEIHTPGDKVNALFAMNPAALKVNIADLDAGGLLVVNKDAFTAENLKKANYDSNPLEDGSLKNYKVIQIPLSTLNQEAVEGLGLDKKSAERCKNFFVLGLAYWIYDRPIEQTLNWLKKKFAKMPEIAEANERSMRAGYHFGETTELIANTYQVHKANPAAGTYRKVTGNEATSLGLITASKISNKPLFYGSYPITPASEILQDLSAKKNFGVTTFQAEDEIAAICAAIGASYGGALAATGTSGPGMALKTEGIGLAVMTELPLVVVNVQRGGPSTGLPTKTEQADLFQALLGRNGECPVPVLAACTPSDCFYMAIEASRIAMKFMTPVILLTDGYLANGAEPLRIPDIDDLPKIDVDYFTDSSAAPFKPYTRNERLARPWALPGTPELMHRVGGLEKEHITGNVSYDPANHDYMIRLRQEKVNGIVEDIPLAQVNGDEEGDLLVVGWGGTYGSIMTAVEKLRQKGKSISSLHIKYLNPFPKNLGAILKRYKKVAAAELNLGQLQFVLRSKFLVDVKSVNKVQGKPFRADELCDAFLEILETI
ncbi:MAG: 2-oxoacid:acceptor oxidoreductase subunit alpha [Candidatus Omnitrophica bacterium]|nr:2-oxoacid:acceptor oxidoreductase subunit alpha [Candidatus Omnitrophota bacterium]